MGERRRQALAAKFGRHRDTDPAARHQLLVGVLEAGWRVHAAIGAPRAAFLVADLVERGEHLFRELGGLAQHRLDDIGRGIGEAGQVAVAIEMEDVVQQEQRIVYWSLVGRHRFLQASCWGAGSPKASTVNNSLTNVRLRPI